MQNVRASRKRSLTLNESRDGPDPLAVRGGNPGIRESGNPGIRDPLVRSCAKLGPVRGTFFQFRPFLHLPGRPGDVLRGH